MTNTTPILPGVSPNPAAAYPQSPAPTPDPEEAHKPVAPHHTFTVPQIKIPLVKATMGAAPMAEVEALQLLAGLPMPANLGPNIDTTA